MNVKQAAKIWNLKENEVRKICKHYGFSKKWFGYEIPEDTVPIYIPDGRYLKSTHRLYFFTCEAINKKIDIDYELIHSNEYEIKTAVRELKKRKLVCIKENHYDNLDYHNYILSPDYSDWSEKKQGDKYKLLKDLLSIVTEAVVKGGVTAVINTK